MTSFRPGGLVLALALATTAKAGEGVPEQLAETVALEEGELTATLEDGATVRGEALAGVVVETGAGTWSARIDAAIPDAHGHDPSRLLYDVSVRAGADGTWQPLCEPDPHGATMAFAIPGRFDGDRFVDATDGRFSFACTAGARGKCIRFGYPPWETAPDGTDLAPHHAACVHMTRADYCGDDTPHTVAGVTIQILDTVGINPDRDPSFGTFEALWGPAGAICIARSRRPEFPLHDILDTCPRLRATPPASCHAGQLGAIPDALLANRS